MVAVELVARDTRGSLEAVLSLGCIQYDSTRYSSKTEHYNNVHKTLLFFIHWPFSPRETHKMMIARLGIISDVKMYFV